MVQVVVVVYLPGPPKGGSQQYDPARLRPCEPEQRAHKARAEIKNLMARQAGSHGPLALSLSPTHGQKPDGQTKVVVFDIYVGFGPEMLF